MSDFDQLVAIVIGVIGLFALLYLAISAIFPEKTDDDNTPYGDTTGWP